MIQRFDQLGVNLPEPKGPESSRRCRRSEMMAYYAKKLG